jgi:hypothetical protein
MYIKMYLDIGINMNTPSRGHSIEGLFTGLWIEKVGWKVARD